ncbi:hypothetical protein M427DRAFT_28298 [Gonapodya prolifera JEL478]|uniref:Uncharacterized protein n=1 Tax=Gonapodya prolifera (strain JEL478) TaxID=1344416 RepID=A0A139AVK4_GONPJ|nr:hypothetical protein M427DRAFT_28298 [Gonapodya prolifera JEL478]|eukprot:KXS20613.1 hypothetical protein M427DRAFT_28298 [Gonapodya prolifera JEL478]
MPEGGSANHRRLLDKSPAAQISSRFRDPRTGKSPYNVYKALENITSASNSIQNQHLFKAFPHTIKALALMSPFTSFFEAVAPSTTHSRSSSTSSVASAGSSASVDSQRTAEALTAAQLGLADLHRSSSGRVSYAGGRMGRRMSRIQRTGVAVAAK